MSSSQVRSVLVGTFERFHCSRCVPLPYHAHCACAVLLLLLLGYCLGCLTDVAGYCMHCFAGHLQ